MRFWIIFFLIMLSGKAFAQTDTLTVDKDFLDSLYIYEFEMEEGPAKVLHAEPLYIDLIRDLGARKGEKEWNVGLGLTDKPRYGEYIALVEYEWAPIDRLGFEVELPFTLYSSHNSSLGGDTIQRPGNRLNSLKLATQWTFLVSEKLKTSMALGYINEFEMPAFRELSNNIFIGNIYNPFFVAAKRWGQNFHTLLYTGPFIIQHFKDNHLDLNWQINTNFHYMIDGTRNFIGIEINQELTAHGLETVFRPQMRVGLADNLLVGIVAGIPVNRENERLSSFLRIIYEPGHRHHHFRAE